jgi:hypothetical protein
MRIGDTRRRFIVVVVVGSTIPAAGESSRFIVVVVGSTLPAAGTR